MLLTSSIEVTEAARCHPCVVTPCFVLVGMTCRMRWSSWWEATILTNVMFLHNVWAWRCTRWPVIWCDAVSTTWPFARSSAVTLGDISPTRRVPTGSRVLTSSCWRHALDLAMLPSGSTVACGGKGPDIFRTDEIHFNSLGNFKLYKSVRGAIYQASRLCQPHYIAVSLCTCMYVSSYCVLIFVRTHCLCPQFTQGILGNRTLGCGSSDDHPPSHLASRLGGTVATLLQASLAPSTRLMYERSWRKITNFLVFLGLSQQLPVAVSTLLLCVAHLYKLSYSPA